MSQVQTQTPKTQAPIYTRYKLELKLLWLNNKLKELREKCWQLIKDFVDVNNTLLELRAESAFRKMVEAMAEAMKACRDDEIVVEYLGLDTNVEKYGVELNHTGRLLGVVLMEDDEVVKPVAIWTNNDEVWYSDGDGT
jgi:hypothetical protein